jgi:hypothetical protein
MGDTDIILDDGDAANHVTLQAGVVKTTANDLEIDAAGRRSGGGRHRRALVHDFGDGLTINYAGDYPAGVKVVSAQINLRSAEQPGHDPKLPDGDAGDLLLICNSEGAGLGGQGFSQTYTLWLCVGSPPQRRAEGGTFWQQIQLGEPVRSTP